VSAPSQFGVIASRVRENGEPGGDWSLLRHVARSSAIACAVCGPLEHPLPYPGENWIAVASAARDHAKATGHQVAAELWHGSVFGPATTRKEPEHG
jgi:hypothetical protein